ncbi:MAG: SpoIID/LytB domain-containing protein [Elusimicrobiota bacterium]|jgi:stage II sporulation protein D|nr:SpoIID/LytB domain-containing protein [Elusimicrobiota bacterium]
MLRRIILISVLFLLVSPSFGLDKIRSDIKIGLAVNTKGFAVSSRENLLITDAQNKKITLQKNTPTRLQFAGGKVNVGNNSMTLPIKIESSSLISINGKHYHGYFSITKSRRGTGLNIINVLSFEDYIKGVVPKEAMSDWNIEALKTQSVISRTYAAASLGRHSAEGFDLCDTTHCQVYGGADVETDASNKAVERTAGEMLTYRGKLAETLFFSNSGGATENPRYVWGWQDTPAYLKGVKDPYSKDQPNYSWETVVPESLIEQKLNIGQISSIKISGKNPSGSAETIVIKHSKGTAVIKAAQFRMTIDPNKIKSTLITSIRKQGSNIIFKGNGWGHRVGLSQWGAKAMADKGFGYKRILTFYYPQTRIEKVHYEK